MVYISHAWCCNRFLPQRFLRNLDCCVRSDVVLMMGPKLFFSKLCQNCVLFPLALFRFMYLKEEEGGGREVPCHLYSGVFVITVILNPGTWRVVITDVGALGQEDTNIQCSVFLHVYLCVSVHLTQQELLQPDNCGCTQVSCTTQHMLLEHYPNT